MNSSIKCLPAERNPSNNSEVLAAVASSRIAVAVVCRTTDTVLLISQGLQALLPRLKKDQSWLVGIAHEFVLLAAYENALASLEVESTIDVVFSGKIFQLKLTTISVDLFTVTMQPELTDAEDLHGYIQARDNLFSTSRTISISEMATTLAHELNTPIGTISNILHGIKVRLKKPDISLEAIDASLDRALMQTQFSRNIINRIRELTQSHRPEFTVLDITQQLHKTVALLDWLLSNNACTVELKLSDEALYVNGDATMLQQILINLISNAVDSMHDQSKEQRIITITVKQMNDRVSVSVADAGHGLLEKGGELFEPFTTSKADRMGVGLNICRSLIELHQGRIWLLPNEKIGCTCFVDLPVASLVELQARSSV